MNVDAYLRRYLFRRATHLATTAGLEIVQREKNWISNQKHKVINEVSDNVQALHILNFCHEREIESNFEHPKSSIYPQTQHQPPTSSHNTVIN